MMQSVEDLEKGFEMFKTNLSNIEKRHYTELSKGQSPRILMISCADSRIDPTSIFGAIPGELFCIRNVANLVPPYCADGQCHGTSAAIEYAVKALEVKLILIFGHTGCGGIRACIEPPVGLDFDFIGPWINIAEEATKKVCSEHHDKDIDTKAYELEKEAILLSIENLKTFPFIAEKMKEGKLGLAGAVFDVAQTNIEWVCK